MCRFFLAPGDCRRKEDKGREENCQARGCLFISCYKSVRDLYAIDRIPNRDTELRGQCSDKGFRLYSWLKWKLQTFLSYAQFEILSNYPYHLARSKMLGEFKHVSFIYLFPTSCDQQNGHHHFGMWDFISRRTTHFLGTTLSRSNIIIPIS